MTPKKFIESYDVPEHLNKFVLTEYGYKRILKVHKTIPYEIFNIELENGMSLDAADTHILINDKGEEVFLINSLGQNLKTVNGVSKVISLRSLNKIESMYDIEIDSDTHLYYSNGILSHNTVSVGNYVLWESCFRSDIIIGLAAQKAGTAREVLSKIRQSFVLLPIWLMPGVTEFNKGRLTFENGTRILTDSTGIDSFRGYSCNIIFVDECFEGITNTRVKNKKTGEISIIRLKDLYDNLSSKNIQVNHNPNNNNFMFSYEAEIALNNEYEVLTQSGWKNFQAIKRVERSESFELTLSNGKVLNATPSHSILVGKSSSGKIFRSFKSLNVGDKIKNLKIVNKQILNETNYFYDLMGVEDTETYIVEDSITSHNCAYIRPSVWKEFTDAILPTQAALSFTKLIFASTANGYNHWYHLVQKARKGEGYHLSEAHWREVPRYDKSGNPITHEEFKEKEIAKNGLLFWNQAHENQFLGSSNTLINSTALGRMVLEEPSLIDSIFNGLRIFKIPEKQHRYIIGVDPAKDGIDKIGIQVIDITQFPFEQVASANLDDSYISIPGKLFDLGTYYNNAMVIVENNIDQSIVDSLYMNYEYPDVFRERNKKILGFRTTTKTKRLMLSHLKKFIEEDKFVVRDQETIDQFFTFVDNGKGSYAAEDLYHDDLIMSLALCFAPFLEIRNFEDFKDFLSKLEAKKKEYEEEEDSILTTISFGYVDADVPEEILIQNQTTFYENRPAWMSEFS